MIKPKLNLKNTWNHTKNIHMITMSLNKKNCISYIKIYVHELQWYKKNIKNLSLLFLFVNQNRKERRKRIIDKDVYELFYRWD